MSFGVLYSSYLGIAYSEIFSFSVIDGWCESATQGIGRHCFGDFYAPITISSTSNPWNDPLKLAYTPISFSYFNLITADQLLGFGQKFPLYLNLVFTVAALGFPGLHLLFKSVNNGHSVKWILAVMLTSTPSLMMIDRGSNNFILVPLLYMYLHKIRQGKLGPSCAILVAMALWKPQMILFGFIFLHKFGLKRFSLAVLAIVMGLLLSFVLYPKGAIANFIEWVGNSRSYQTYAPSPSIGNYSFASFTGLLESLGNKVFNPSHSFSLLEHPLSANEVSLISLIFGVLAFGSLLLARNHISDNYIFLAVTVFFLQLPGTTFGYYMIFLLLPLVFLTIDNELKHVVDAFKSLNYGIFGVLLITLVPAWPISIRVLGINPGDTFNSIGVTWAVSHFLLSVLSVLLIIDLFRTFFKYRKLGSQKTLTRLDSLLS
jgi:hypothetical protein